jgi:hypothetical protein
MIAVTAGLNWLVEHQLADGGWSLDHTSSPRCFGKCGDPGSAPSRNAATALALLPFLRAGHTHKEGDSQKTIERGLNFLVGRLKVDRERGSLWEPSGNMYSHALGALALCEAYERSGDPTLRTPVQQAIDFTCYAQAKQGGWRYEPRDQIGDTSITGWQIQVLKVGETAGLRVPATTLSKVSEFLNHVQTDNGSRYAYQRRDKKASDSCTAIGLLSRMLLGWGPERRPLERGVESLADQGPSDSDLYYNYYATQLMRHYGGQTWREWKARLDDQLIELQATSSDSHEQGSWFVPKRTNASRGGRLYHTALALLALEAQEEIKGGRTVP